MIEINKTHCMDCIEGLKQLDDESVQCIWTDPPYNINYNYGKDQYKDKREDYLGGFYDALKWVLEND